MIELKETRLAGEKPSCRLERISLDLTDRALRRKLFADVSARSNKLLVLTEGVIPSPHLGGSEPAQTHYLAVLHAGLVRPQEPVRVAGAPRGVETICRLRAPGPEVIGASGRLEQDDVIGHLWRMRRETGAA